MTLTALDFLGFGLPPARPRSAIAEVRAKPMCRPVAWPHRIFSIAIMLSLFDLCRRGVRDAFRSTKDISMSEPLLSREGSFGRFRHRQARDSGGRSRVVDIAKETVAWWAKAVFRQIS